MTAITIQVPPDIIKVIDELRERELLSRSHWLRRELILAVRSYRIDQMAEVKGSA
jgi:hypothetical protein